MKDGAIALYTSNPFVKHHDMFCKGKLKVNCFNAGSGIFALLGLQHQPAPAGSENFLKLEEDDRRERRPAGHTNKKSAASVPPIKHCELRTCHRSLELSSSEFGVNDSDYAIIVFGTTETVTTSAKGSSLLSSLVRGLVH